MSEGKLVIAIDGPAGSGKSTIAQRVAVELGLRYVDTGAMYRAVGLRVARQPDPEAAMERAGDEARAARIETLWDPERSHFAVILDGDDVSGAIRTPLAAEWASRVAVLAEVRSVLTEQQRRMGDGGIVMEGRDIGTQVFPDADHKFFLDADLTVRVRRRGLDEQRADSDVQGEMAVRDERDSTRSIAPLATATDAIRIDTTSMSIEEVVNFVLRAIRM